MNSNWNQQAFEAGKVAGRQQFNTGSLPVTPSWVYEQNAYTEYSKGIDCGIADARYEYMTASS